MTQQMTKVFVEYSSITDHYEHDGEEYGSWSQLNTFTVDRVSLSKPSGYVNIEEYGLPDVKAGDFVHVLWMIYSSGDSFGNSDGNGEILWVFKDIELAKKAYTAINQECAKRDQQFSIKIETDTGEILEMSNPAAGYFENMSNVELQSFLVYP